MGQKQETPLTERLAQTDRSEPQNEMDYLNNPVIGARHHVQLRNADDRERHRPQQRDDRKNRLHFGQQTQDYNRQQRERRG